MMPSRVLFSLLVLAFGLHAQQQTKTCLFLTGPAKGKTQTFPGGTATAVGQPCQDGTSSTGVAVPPAGPVGSFSMNADTPVCRDAIGTGVPYKPNEGIPKSGLSTIDGN